jgi:g-D-glutamyl-meso-diaminopimelate peptidase
MENYINVFGGGSLSKKSIIFALSVLAALCVHNVVYAYPTEHISNTGKSVRQVQNIVNPYRTYTYTQMRKDLAALKARYPDLIHTEIIGKTAYGRNIYALSLGKGRTNSLIVASTHAREWITTNLTMYMIEQYAKEYKQGDKTVRNDLNSTTLWFVPMLNPDGVTLVQEGLKAFPASDWKKLIAMNGGSKNFSRWKANAKGVDLNRQFDGRWAQINYQNANRPWYENYKGKAPLDQPESKALMALIKRIDPKMEVSYHASGQVIYWGLYNDGFYRYAKQLHKITGYGLVFEHSGFSGGGLTDWFTQVGKEHRPGFTIEVGTGATNGPVPLKEFNTIWKQNKGVGLYLAYESPHVK